MKRLCLLLAIALLLCLGACGTGTETQTTSEEPTTAEVTTTVAAATFPEMTSDEILAEIFRPAFAMYAYLNHGGLEYDFEDRFGYDDWEYNRWEYARVTDTRFPSIAALEAAAREVFSAELMQSYLGLTAEDWLSDDADEARRENARQYPLLLERDGKLYMLIGNRGGYLSDESIRVDSQSESKIVYILHAVSHWEGDPVISEEHTFHRELIGGKWVFTVFPMEWY